MKAVAKHWVNYNGDWHPAGEAFDIDPADAEEMKQYAEILPEEAAPEEPKETAHDERAVEEPAQRRGRKRKTEQ